ncbi:hypothetical protein TNCV_2591281 [Trichonephila clavipes]|nr:hypothetical protein TNCV_2591281 [Trichonephila clavipes]
MTCMPTIIVPRARIESQLWDYEVGTLPLTLSYGADVEIYITRRLFVKDLIFNQRSSDEEVNGAFPLSKFPHYVRVGTLSFDRFKHPTPPTSGFWPQDWNKQFGRNKLANQLPSQYR